ncbi:Carbonic anhydrase 7 [Fragariocoptes setiger]|uniref:Carbonic anhydrase n=1 Tax=Fragariocoptes setiger TaxID=1670756 RepID=A0ABQ7S9S2_9ACAR|nr:Carbonic anhydrase 7 [Fragariocoptes setiger]
MATNMGWGYEPHELEPSQWNKEFNAGKRQSPIDIVFDDTCECILARTTEHNSSNANGNANNNGSNHHHATSGTHDTCQRLSRRLTLSDTNTTNNQTMKKTTTTPFEQHRNHVRYHVSNKKIFLGYPRCLNNLRIMNTGHAWQVDIPREIGPHTLLCGPPLRDRQYRLAQFHCHWGAREDACGSEHTINGQGYSAEIHFVHWNCTQFESIEKAAKHRHGLAVVAVFLRAVDGEQNRNKYIDKIIANIDDICQRTGQSAPVADHVDLKLLFPANRWAYASYEGSLTTPPLSEVVDWIVFFNPITCSTSQVNQTELSDLISRFSSNPLGFIHYREFLRIMEAIINHDLNGIRDFYRSYDTNGNGFIDREEFSAIFKQLDPTITDDLTDEIMSLIKPDHDGKVEYELFVQWVFQRQQH